MTLSQQNPRLRVVMMMRTNLLQLQSVVGEADIQIKSTMNQAVMNLMMNLMSQRSQRIPNAYWLTVRAALVLALGVNQIVRRKVILQQPKKQKRKENKHQRKRNRLGTISR